MKMLFLASRAFTPFRGGIERFSLTLGDRFVSEGQAWYLTFNNNCTLYGQEK